MDKQKKHQETEDVKKDIIKDNASHKGAIFLWFFST